MNKDFRNFNAELEKKLSVVARIDGWEYMEDSGVFTKLLRTGQVYYAPEELLYDISLNWLMPVMCRINMCDKWWKIFITDCSVVMTKDSRTDKAIYVGEYRKPGQLVSALFEMIYKYGQYRLNSKDFQRILENNKEQAIAKHAHYKEWSLLEKV